MKGSYIWAVAIIAFCAIISLDLWRLWKEEAKTAEIRAVKESIVHSIYIDSLRTRSLLDSLTRIGRKIQDHEYRLEAYNRAVRVQNQLIRKQNENFIHEIDSLRSIIIDRPEF